MTDDPIPPQLSVHRSPDGGPPGLVVEGEVDLATAERFGEALLAVLDGHRELHVDLRAVTFMDSTGLRALLETRRRAEESGAVISLDVQPDGPVERLLDLAGVSDMFARSQQRPEHA